MIYVIVGDKKLATDLACRLTSTYCFYGVDLDAVLRGFKDDYKYPILTNPYYRRQFIRVLKGYFKHLVLISNALCSSRPEELLVDPICVITVDNEDSERTQRLKKDLGNYLYTSDEIDPVLQKDTSGGSLSTEGYNMGMENFIKLIQSIKESQNMGKSLEECIKEQLEALGMSVEQPKKVEEKKPEPKKVDVPKKEEKLVEPKPSKPKESKIEKVEPPKAMETTIPEYVVEEIFCKIINGKMAIMIPAGTTMEKRVLGNQEFMVVTVPTPDLELTKLQVLPVLKEKPEPKKEEKPVPPKPKVEEKKPEPKKEEKPDGNEPLSEDLMTLQQEKSVLDSKIKEARKEGNESLVLELRKQRRTLRKKINALKES